MSSSNEHAVSVEDLTDEPATKKKSKKLRSWTEIDAKGQTKSMKLDNYAIRQRVQISVRDLWILDRDDIYPSTILAREKAILFNVETLKMIITAKEVLILEGWSDYPARFRERLVKMMLSPETDSDTENESAFEFRALNLALESLYSFLYHQTKVIRSFVSQLQRTDSSMNYSHTIKEDLNPLAVRLQKGADSSDMYYSHKIKEDLNTLTVRVQKVCDEIKRLMENEHGLAEFYLSRKLARASSSSGEPMLNPTSHVVDNDVDELQMLLEKHFYQIKSIAEKLCEIKGWVDTKLDRVRNQLIKFELIISSASICLSVFSLVAGILGMNIPFSWNNQKDMFKRVVIVTGTICVILFVIIMSYARYKNLIGNSDQKGWKRFAAEFR